MSETVIADLLLILSITILFAKVLEELLSIKGYPPILGDILAGIILGPSIAGLLSTEIVREYSLIKWISIISLLFLAGLETRFGLFMKALKKSLLVAVGGIVVSFTLGYLSGYFLGLGYRESIFLGAIFTATSVGLTVKTLADLGALGSDIATTILGAAVLDDVGGLLVLGLCTAIIVSGTTKIVDLVITATIAIVFYIAVVVSLHRSSTTIWRGITRLSHLEDTNIALLLSLTLLIAWASVRVNLSLVVGAYAVGLAFSEIHGIERVVRRFSLIPNIFASIFFVLSAASIDVKPYIVNPSYLADIVVIVLAAMAGKIVGCGLLARIAGYNWFESIFIGIGMMPRAEVALIISSIGMAYHVVPEAVFASVIILVYTTSLATPIALSRIWRRFLEKS